MSTLISVIHSDGDVIVLKMEAGDMDVYCAENILSELNQVIDKGAKFIVLDLSNVEYMDSVALGALIQVLKRAQDIDVTIYLATLGPRAVRLFDLVGATKIFNIFKTTDECLAEIEAVKIASKRKNRRGSGLKADTK